MEHRRLTIFVRLARATTIATYLLILVGALVRASGAGLGCPDWPHCYGSWIPPVSASQLPAGFDPATFNPMLTWTEYVNRLLGVSIGLLIVATFVVAATWFRGRPRLFWPTLSALLLVGFQGWLGGQVVRSGLTPWIITAHMVLALVIVSLLLYATYHAAIRRAGLADRAPTPARRRFGYALAAVLVLLLFQIGLGTQVRAGMEHAVDMDPDLPRGEWLAQVPDVDGAHRGTANLVALAVVVMGLWARQRFGHDRVLVRSLQVAGGLLAVQILLGLALAGWGVPPWAQVLHLSVASLLLGAMMIAFLRTQREPVLETVPQSGAQSSLDGLRAGETV